MAENEIILEATVTLKRSMQVSRGDYPDCRTLEEIIGFERAYIEEELSEVLRLDLAEVDIAVTAKEIKA